MRATVEISRKDAVALKRVERLQAFVEVAYVGADLEQFGHRCGVGNLFGLKRFDGFSIGRHFTTMGAHHAQRLVAHNGVNPALCGPAQGVETCRFGSDVHEGVVQPVLRQHTLAQDAQRDT